MDRISDFLDRTYPKKLPHNVLAAFVAVFVLRLPTELLRLRMRRDFIRRFDKPNRRLAESVTINTRTRNLRLKAKNDREPFFHLFLSTRR